MFWPSKRSVTRECENPVPLGLANLYYDPAIADIADDVGLARLTVVEETLFVLR